MRVRRLVLGDELVVLRAGYLFDDPPDLPAIREYLADDRNTLLFAFEGSDPVGFLRATELLQLKTRRRQMFLYEISVDEKFRRRRIGTTLVRTLITMCQENGFEEVFVFTDPANTAAVGLYRATGAATDTVADRMYVYQLHSPMAPPA